MAKNCNTSPFYLQGQSPTIQNQVAIIERFLKKQLPNYAVITVSLNGVDIPKDEFGNVDLSIETIKGEKGDKGDPGEKGEKGDKGDTGINGIDGKDGEDGADGIDGSDGADGKSAYEIWIEQGNEGTEEDFLEWLRQGSYLKQIGNLDEYEGETDEIVQYIGETNSKYTNGYVYKKVGTQTVIPSGTKYIDIVDNEGNLELVGIPNGRYYSINDDTDTIKTKIRYSIFSSNSNIYGVAGGSPCYATLYHSFNAVTGIYGVSNSAGRKFSKVVSDVFYDGGRKITFEDGTTITTTNGGSGESIGSPFLSSILMFESTDGIRIYAMRGDYCPPRTVGSLTRDDIAVLALDYSQDEDVYVVVTPIDRFAYKLKELDSSQIIDSAFWQQWDVQPRNDTSHYITDSDIGWIEH